MSELIKVQKDDNKIVLPEKIQEIITTVVDIDKSLNLTKAESLAMNYAPFMGMVAKQIEKYKKLEKGNPDHLEDAKRVSLDCGKIVSATTKQKQKDKALLLIETRLIDKLFGVVECTARLTQADAKEIAEFQENINKAEIEAYQISRATELVKYECDPIPGNLGEMEDNIWENFLTGTRVNYETRIAAARKVEEENNLHFARYSECLDYSDFTANIIDINMAEFGVMNQEEYDVILNKLKDAKKAKDREGEVYRLRKERKGKLNPIWEFVAPADRDLDLGEITGNDFNIVQKTALESKEEFDKEEAEKLRIKNLHNERKEVIFPLWQYTSVSEKVLNFGKVSDTDYKSMIERLNNFKKEDEEKQEALKIENDRLIQEKYDKEVADKEWEERRNLLISTGFSIDGVFFFIPDFIRMDTNEVISLPEDNFHETLESGKVELKRRAVVEAEKKEADKKIIDARNIKRNEELKPYIVFIRDYNKLLNSDEESYQKELTEIKRGAQIQWEYDREQEKIKADKIESDRVKAEELQKEKDEEMKVQADLKKGDAEKLQDMILELDTIRTKYKFESKVNKAKNIDVDCLINSAIEILKK